MNKVSLRLETSTDIREVFMGVSLLKEAGKSIATICQKLAEWVPNHGNPTYQPKKHVIVV